MTNRFAVSRAGEAGVLWFRFRGQNGNSGLDSPTLDQREVLIANAVGRARGKPEEKHQAMEAIFGSSAKNADGGRP